MEQSVPKQHKLTYFSRLNYLNLAILPSCACLHNDFRHSGISPAAEGRPALFTNSIDVATVRAWSSWHISASNALLFNNPSGKAWPPTIAASVHPCPLLRQMRHGQEVAAQKPGPHYSKRPTTAAFGHCCQRLQCWRPCQVTA